MCKQIGQCKDSARSLTSDGAGCCRNDVGSARAALKQLSLADERACTGKSDSFEVSVGAVLRDSSPRRSGTESVSDTTTRTVPLRMMPQNVAFSFSALNHQTPMRNEAILFERSGMAHFG
jgi:hypothetical protein